MHRTVAAILTLSVSVSYCEQREDDYNTPSSFEAKAIRVIKIQIITQGNGCVLFDWVSDCLLYINGSLAERVDRLQRFSFCGGVSIVRADIFPVAE